VTKAGVVALSETLYGEFAGTNLGVTVLCPTFFRTNIARNARGEDPAMTESVEALMDRTKIQAPQVARLALDGADAGDLYVVPHSDGRWFWRIKRAAPQGYFALMPRLLNAMRRRASRRSHA
jgi:short-subunit dehydrogenase